MQTEVPLSCCIRNTMQNSHEYHRLEERLQLFKILKQWEVGQTDFRMHAKMAE